MSKGVPLASRAAATKASGVSAAPLLPSPDLPSPLLSSPQKSVRFSVDESEITAANEQEAPAAAPRFSASLVKDVVVERWQSPSVGSDGDAEATKLSGKPSRLSSLFSARLKSTTNATAASGTGFPQAFRMAGASGDAEAAKLLAARDARLHAVGSGSQLKTEQHTRKTSAYAQSIIGEDPEAAAIHASNAARVQGMSAGEVSEALDEISGLLSAETLELLRKRHAAKNKTQTAAPTTPNNPPAAAAPIDLSTIRTEEELFAAAARHLPAGERAKLGWTGALGGQTDNATPHLHHDIGTFHIHDMFAQAAEELMQSQVPSDADGDAGGAALAVQRWLLQLGVNPTDPYASSLLPSSPLTALSAAQIAAGIPSPLLPSPLNATGGVGLGEAMARDPARYLRFDFEGRVVSTSGVLPRVEALLSEESAHSSFVQGLHNHGADPEAPGYSLFELCGLMRSTVASQRIIAYKTVEAILAKRRAAFLSDATGTSAHSPSQPAVQSMFMRHLGLPPALPILIRCGLDEVTATSLLPALAAAKAFLVPCAGDGAVEWDEYQLRRWDVLDVSTALSSEGVSAVSKARLFAAAPVRLSATSVSCLSSHVLAQPPPVSFITSSEYLRNGGVTLSPTSVSDLSKERSASQVAAEGRGCLLDPIRVMSRQMGLLDRLITIVHSLVSPCIGSPRLFSALPDCDVVKHALEIIFACVLMDAECGVKVCQSRVDFRGERVGFLPVLMQELLLRPLEHGAVLSRKEEDAMLPLSVLTADLLAACVACSRLASVELCNDPRGICPSPSEAIAPLTLDRLTQHFPLNSAVQDYLQSGIMPEASSVRRTETSLRVAWSLMRTVLSCCRFGAGIDMAILLWQTGVLQPRVAIITEGSGSAGWHATSQLFNALSAAIVTAVCQVCNSEVSGGNGVLRRAREASSGEKALKDPLFEAAEKLIREGTVQAPAPDDRHDEVDVFPLSQHVKAMATAWFDHLDSLTLREPLEFLVSSCILRMAASYVASLCKVTSGGVLKNMQYNLPYIAVPNALPDMVTIFANPLAKQDAFAYIIEKVLEHPAIVTLPASVQSGRIMTGDAASSSALTTPTVECCALLLELHTDAMVSPAAHLWESKCVTAAMDLERALHDALQARLPDAVYKSAGHASDGITAVIDANLAAARLEGAMAGLGPEFQERGVSIGWTADSLPEHCGPTLWWTRSAAVLSAPLSANVLVDAAVAVVRRFRARNTSDSIEVRARLAQCTVRLLQPGFELVAWWLFAEHICDSTAVSVRRSHRAASRALGALWEQLPQNLLRITCSDPRFSRSVLDACLENANTSDAVTVLGYDPESISFVRGTRHELSESRKVPAMFRHRWHMPASITLSSTMIVSELEPLGAFADEYNEVSEDELEALVAAVAGAASSQLELPQTTAHLLLAAAWESTYTSFAAMHCGLLPVTSDQLMRSFAVLARKLSKPTDGALLVKSIRANPWVGAEPLKTLANKLAYNVGYHSEEAGLSLLVLVQLLQPVDDDGLSEVRTIAWNALASSGSFTASFDARYLHTTLTASCTSTCGSDAGLKEVARLIHFRETRAEVLAALEAAATQLQAPAHEGIIASEFAEGHTMISAYDVLVSVLAASCLNSTSDSTGHVAASFEAGEMLRRVSRSSMGAKIIEDLHEWARRFGAATTAD